MSRFSKNYLPILFNLYTDPDGKADHKPPLIDCIKAYVSISGTYMHTLYTYGWIQHGLAMYRGEMGDEVHGYNASYISQHIHVSIFPGIHHKNVPVYEDVYMYCTIVRISSAQIINREDP